MGHSRPLFLYFCVFKTVDSKWMFNTNFAYHLIRTADLWSWKRMLYQLSLNHCPAHFCLWLIFSSNRVDINGSCKLRMGKVENFAVENSSKICNNLVMLKYNLRQPIWAKINVKRRRLMNNLTNCPTYILSSNLIFVFVG